MLLQFFYCTYNFKDAAMMFKLRIIIDTDVEKAT